jgi:hypothetical protein
MVRDARQILAVVDRLYAAAASPEQWTPAIESIVALLDGAHGALHLGNADGTTRFAAFAGLDVDDRALFASPEAVKLAAPFTALSPINTAFSSSQLWSERDFERSAFYNEVIRPANGFHGAGVIRPLPLGLLLLSICRPRSASDFDASEIETLQVLLPHLATAVELGQRLRIASEGHASLMRVLDRLDSGVVLVNASGVPVYANAQALSIVAEADGLALNGGLTATTPEADKATACRTGTSRRRLCRGAGAACARAPLASASAATGVSADLAARCDGARRRQRRRRHLLDRAGRSAIDRTPDGRRCLQTDQTRERDRGQSGGGAGPRNHRADSRHSRCGGAAIFETSFRQNRRA